jgi:hypothetical protein
MLLRNEFLMFKVSDVPIRSARGSRSSAEIYDEREYFRLENSAASCGSLVALEYSARAQPSGRSIKNGSQVEWNLLFFTLIQWSTWRLIQTKQKYLWTTTRTLHFPNLITKTSLE